MDKNTQSSSNQSNAGYKIPLTTLGVLIIAFLLGYAIHGMMQNVLGATSLTFSTPELINFVLSVVLSGASTFLAIAAIALGKFSEQAMIQRSDESIRLQNEVFHKTTDALQRIESSTGVTEKRIEDIISGRVGDISQKIARIASEKQHSKGSLGESEIAEMVRKSLLQSLKEEGVFSTRNSSAENRRRAEEENRKQVKEQADQYQTRHDRLLKAFSMRDDLKAVKLGHGSPDDSGDGLFDGIYLRKDSKRLAVIDFYTGHATDFFQKGISASLIELQKGSVEFVYIFLYEDIESFKKAFDDVISVSAPELREKIALKILNPDEIEKVSSTLPTGR